jgi:DNA recombination protein RmuC
MESFPAFEPDLWHVLFAAGLTIAALCALVAASAWSSGRRMQARLRDDLAAAREGLAAAHASESARAEALALARAEIETAQGALDVVRREAAELAASLAAHQAAADARARALAEREAAFETLAKSTQETFQNLANDALRRNQTSFLEVANQTLEQQREAAQGSLAAALAPVQEALGQFREKIDAVQKERAEDRASLVEQVRGVAEALERTRSETGRLVTALRASPTTRGRWGEEQLRNVLELSGMSPYADFTEQSSHEGETGNRLRPDVILRLPGGRLIVIDSKVALDAYLQAVDAPDEAQRDLFMKRHAEQMKTHARSLSSKQYVQNLPEAVDFTAMFVPGENFFAAAVERDPDLFQDALKNRVVIVTPATLFALARAVAFGWRQAEAEKNAAVIAGLGKELYKRVADMGDRIARLGKALDGGVRAYNDLVATVEARVLPQARRFRDVEAHDPDKAIADLSPLEIATRAPRAGGELALPGAAADQG